MQAFKLYFKIFKRSAFFMVLLYLLIFGLIVALFALNFKNSSDMGFEAQRSRIAVVDNDDSKFSKAFASYINENSQPVELGTGEQAIKDALFFNDADYIIIIPKGFGEDFLKDGNARPRSYSLPNSIRAVYAQRMAESYLKLFDLYIKSGNFSFEQAKENVEADLALKTKATIVSINKSDTGSLKRTVDYVAYAITCMVILSVSLTMLAIEKGDAKKRNLASPISASKIGLQVFLGNAVVSLICCGMIILLVIAIFREDFFNIYGAWYSLNILIYTLVCLGMSFLIGNLVPKNAVNAVCNVIALGGSFLGGAFVPQSLLSETVKNIAVIDPIFWFVKANNEILSISTFNLKTLSPALYCMLVQLLFAALFFSAAMLVIKYKRTKS